jgi:hypothetical protein
MCCIGGPCDGEVYQGTDFGIGSHLRIPLVYPNKTAYYKWVFVNHDYKIAVGQHTKLPEFTGKRKPKKVKKK